MCYNCGKLGHKLPDCPLKVNRVATYNETKLLSLDGTVCGKKCKLTLDSGTKITVVNEYEYTADSIKLVGLWGSCNLAMAQIKTKQSSFPHEIVVIADIKQDVLIGMDVVHFKELRWLAYKAQKAQVNVNTRAQTKKLASEKLNDHDVNKQDSASPDSADLQAVEEEVVESDITVAENEDKHGDYSSSNITDEHSDDIFSDNSALAKDLAEMGDSEEWPLPKLSSTYRDRKELLAYQKQDSCLEKVRKWKKNRRISVWLQRGSVNACN